MFSLTIDRSEAVQAAFDRLLEISTDARPIMRAIAAVLADSTEQAFADERDPATGQLWKKWSGAYEKKRRPGAKLQLSQGGLASSVQTESGADFALISSNKIYAAIHQLGGTADMSAGPAAIPARPYFGLDATAEEEIIGIIAGHITLAFQPAD